MAPSRLSLVSALLSASALWSVVYFVSVTSGVADGGTTSSGAATSTTSSTTTAPSCVLLRFKDQNLDVIEQAALRAGGLGEGAGQYLTKQQVADIAGRSPSEIQALDSYLSTLGGYVEEIGTLRDAVTVCFPPEAGAQLLASYPPPPSPPQPPPSPPSGQVDRGASQQQQLPFIPKQVKDQGLPLRKRNRNLLRRGLSAGDGPTLLPPPGNGESTGTDADLIAAALPLALPPHLSDMLHFALPLRGNSGSASSLSSSSSSDQGGTTATSSGGGQGAGSNGGSRKLRKYVPRRHPPPSPRKMPPAPPPGFLLNPLASTLSNTLTALIPGPYPGTYLQGGDPTLGIWIGTPSKSRRTAVAIGWFSTDSPLVYLGTSNYSYILNHITWIHQIVTMILPCRVSYTNSANTDVDSIQYAKAGNASAAACAASFTSIFTEDYSNFRGGRVNRRVDIPANTSAVTVMSCGQAILNSQGKLPPDLCTSIGSQMAAATRTTNDIGNDTALYTFDQMDMGTPFMTNLMNRALTINLASTLPDEFRIAKLSGIDFSTSGPATPPNLFKIYNFTPGVYGGRGPGGGGAAKGTITAVGAWVGFRTYYYISPFDVEIASKAFSLQVPTIDNLTDLPYYEPNLPGMLYGPPNRQLTNKGNDWGWIIEASLDMQMVTQYGSGSGTTFGVSAPTNNPVVYDSVSEANAQLYELLIRPLPDVISWSFGSSPSPSASGVGSIDTSVYTSLSKFAALGITAIGATGDSGAFSPTRGTCKDPILPSYPAASPWVTAVGAVMQLKTSPYAKEPSLISAMPTAGSVITSGGGFGLVDVPGVPGSPLPAWQRNVVQAYIDASVTLPSWPLGKSSGNRYAWISDPCDVVNKTTGAKYCVYGRGYPDVSLVGTTTTIVVSGQPAVLYGTSVSAPVFAGLVAQINAAIRATPGLENRTIGWMNPFLYWAADRYPNAFTDITVGSNRYNQDATLCPLGYETAKGWDAVTGLGVPNIGVLQQAAIEYVTMQVKGIVPPLEYSYV